MAEINDYFSDEELLQAKETFKKSDRIHALIRRLEAAEHALQEGEIVTTHPCFTIGTKAYGNLPVGLYSRIAALDEALNAWRQAAGK